MTSYRANNRYIIKEFFVIRPYIQLSISLIVVILGSQDYYYSGFASVRY